MNNETPAGKPKDSLKAFLQDEIKDIRKRLGELKGKLHADDFQAMEAEVNELAETLEALTDEDDTQMFIVRRELAMLREKMEALAVKQSRWSRLPFSVKVAVFVVPVLLYFAWLSFVQLRHQGQIYNYPATQTAVAAQTMLPGPTLTITPTPTQLP